jgi:hypothetical protein
MEDVFESSIVSLKIEDLEKEVEELMSEVSETFDKF